jgi:hypothetical protein
MEVPLPYRAASLKLAFYLGNPAFTSMQRIGILRSPVRLVRSVLRTVCWVGRSNEGLLKCPLSIMERH